MKRYFSRIIKCSLICPILVFGFIFNNFANSQSLPPETAKSLQDILNNTRDSFNLIGITIVTTAWSGSGMLSNAENIARWCRSLYSGKVLEQDSMKQMFSLINNYYGLGVMRLSCPMGGYFGHTGWIPGFISLMGYFQNDDVSLVVLVNQDDKDMFGIYNAISGKISDVLESLAVDLSGKLSTVWGKIKMEGF